MDNWTMFVQIYIEKLHREKRKHEIKLRRLELCLHELRQQNPNVSTEISRRIRKIVMKIWDARLTIEALTTLIEDTENGAY